MKLHYRGNGVGVMVCSLIGRACRAAASALPARRRLQWASVCAAFFPFSAGPMLMPSLASGEPLVAEPASCDGCRALFSITTLVLVAREQRILDYALSRV